MKMYHRLSFTTNLALEEYLTTCGVELKTSPIPGPNHRYIVHCNVDEEDTNWLTIKKRIEGMDVLDYRVFRYEDEDYQQAEWFQLSVSESAYPQPQNPSEYKKATYNLKEYCLEPSCHVGFIQDKPFRLKTDIQNTSYMLLGLHWAFDAVFCRTAAKNILESEKITGTDFTHPVFHATSKEITNLWQINIEQMLPAGYISPSEKQHICPVCGRTKYSIPIDQPLTFKKSIFDTAADFVYSNEWFGNGGAAFKIPIVSRKVYKLTQSLKWKGFALRPLLLID